MKNETKQKLIAWLGAAFIRSLGWTLRIRVVDEAGILSGEHQAPVIFAYWHNRMLAMPVAYTRWYRQLVRSGKRKGLVVLISKSRDGKLISDIIRHFNIGVVSGSSSRGGASALLELATQLHERMDVNITPDGPRGPVYSVGPGLVFLAQKTGACISPVHSEYSNCVRFKSWDRFMVPLPFSRIDITIGRLLQIPPTDSDEAFEAERLKIEKIMQPVTS